MFHVMQWVLTNQSPLFQSFENFEPTIIVHKTLHKIMQRSFLRDLIGWKI